MMIVTLKKWHVQFIIVANYTQTMMWQDLRFNEVRKVACLILILNMTDTHRMLHFILVFPLNLITHMESRKEHFYCREIMDGGRLFLKELYQVNSMICVKL